MKYAVEKVIFLIATVVGVASIALPQWLKFLPRQAKTPNRIENVENPNKSLFRSLRDVNSIETTVVSTECMVQVEILLEELAKDDMLQVADWALQMSDAWGKVPEGILRGHVSALGDFDECISIQVDDSQNEVQVKGQYCSVGIIPTPYLLHLTIGNETIRIPLARGPLVSIRGLINHINKPFDGGMSVIPTIGTCFPAVCSQSDVQLLMSQLVAKLGLDLYISPTTNLCSTGDQPKLGAGEIAMISTIAMLVILVLVGTFLEHIRNKKDHNGNLLRPKDVPVPEMILLSFSLLSNTRKLFSTNEPGNSDSFSCLHGIRFLTICWVVLGHTWYALTMQPTWNTIEARMLFDDGLPIFAILNFSTSVDTFFTIAGLLVAYNLLKALDKSKGKMNIPMLYLHRYIRLTPMVAFCVGFTATLWPFLGSGPNWFIADMLSGFCKQSWWQNLLYLNNFSGVAKNGAFGRENIQCLGHAWYVATDMQYYLLSPFLLYVIWRWRKTGLSLLAALTIASVLIPTLITYFNDLLPTAIYRDGYSKYQMDGYFRPWLRFGPYLVGIWTGCVLHYTKRSSIKIPKTVVAIFWVISTVMALAIVFGPYQYWNPDKPIERISSAFYAGLHRTAWAICIGWIIFACTKDYGGFVSSFLSCKLFLPLSRLTFGIYLVSWPLQMTYHLRIRQPMDYDLYITVNTYLAHLLMSILVSLVLTLMVESPFIALEKVIFRRKQTKSDSDRYKAETELGLGEVSTSTKL